MVFKALSYWVAAKTSARIAAPPDCLQVIESSSHRVAEKTSGRGTSSRRAIRSSASHSVIEALSYCRVLGHRDIEPSS